MVDLNTRKEEEGTDGNGAGRDGFHYPIFISVKKIYPHPHTQTQRVSNFYLIPIPTG